jgi:adenine deaminase
MKYGGLSEEQALKLITINPATQLGVEKRVGSIEVGKDADLVLYTAHPLSTFAIPQQVLIDGVVYFDRQKDLQQRDVRAKQKLALKDKEKAGTTPARPSPPDTTPKAETTPRYEEYR